LSLEGWTGSLTVGESLNWSTQYSTNGAESIFYSRNPRSDSSLPRHGPGTIV
jgi:hypothetical protein